MKGKEEQQLFTRKHICNFLEGEGRGKLCESIHP